MPQEYGAIIFVIIEAPTVPSWGLLATLSLHTKVHMGGTLVVCRLAGIDFRTFLQKTSTSHDPVVFPGNEHCSCCLGS